MGMIDIGVHVSSHLKEELACNWAVDKWLWVISTIMLFKQGIIFVAPGFYI